jgi:hypothetical protein
MRKWRNDDTIAFILLVLLAIPVVWFSMFVTFERESGDNIVHYYFARYAFQYPGLYLDVWAKPVFTLLASPFAQLGFSGMKLFNGFVGLASALIAYLVARKMKFWLPWMAILFTFFAPTYFTLLFTGYTEPLFGLFMISGLWLVILRKYDLAAILISLIPFIRTEGVLIVSLFGFYFLLKKQWKPILLLLSGSLILGLAGMLAGKSFLWIIHEVPYSVKSDYGSGTLSHYAEQWLLAVGVPLTVSSVAGLFLLPFDRFRKWKVNSPEKPNELHFFLPLLFLAYFIFHSLCWYWGLFTSYGLIRILVPLIPLQAIISLYAFQRIRQLIAFNSRIGWLSMILFGAYVLVFPFLNNPGSVNWKRDFHQRPELALMQRISKDIRIEYPNSYLYYSEPYLSYALGINHFDSLLHGNFTEIPLSQIKSNSIIIWDDWTSRHFVKYSCNFDSLPGFRPLKTYTIDSFGRKVILKTYYHP